MIPKIDFSISNLDDSPIEVGCYSDPFFVFIEIRNTIPFQVCSAKIIIENQCLFKIAELDEFEKETVYWSVAKDIFTLSRKTNINKIHTWLLIMSRSPLSQGTIKNKLNLIIELL